MPLPSVSTEKVNKTHTSKTSETEDSTNADNNTGKIHVLSVNNTPQQSSVSANFKRKSDESESSDFEPPANRNSGGSNISKLPVFAVTAGKENLPENIRGVTKNIPAAPFLSQQVINQSPASQNTTNEITNYDLSRLRKANTGATVSKNTPPKFATHFDTASIGIEIELKGVRVAMSKQAGSREFGYVRDKDGNALFMLTKDMGNGDYSKKFTWRPHVLELVSYPCEMSDDKAVKSRNEALQWIETALNEHVRQGNHKALSELVSEDGQFTLAISNKEHSIFACDEIGNSVSEDSSIKYPKVSIDPGGIQATIGVKAEDFGTGSSEEMRLLESVHWYKSNAPFFKDTFASKTQGMHLDAPKTAENIFVYLASIHAYTAQLVQQHGISIEDWKPATMPDNPKMLTDPDVKNSWHILPRTKPSAMLDLLSPNDRRIVYPLIKAGLEGHGYTDLFKDSIYHYFLNGGEVAGHGINNATTGTASNPRKAILFEFRDLPKELTKYCPVATEIETTHIPDAMDKLQQKEIIEMIRASSGRGNKFTLLDSDSGSDSDDD